MDITKSTVAGIIILSFAIGLYFYSDVPDRMASHWNVGDEVDGYIPKFWGLFLLPLIMSGIAVLFFKIPDIDPLKKNIVSFRKYYDSFVVLMTGFLFYVYSLTILWNLGIRFPMSLAILPPIGLILFYSGVLLEHSKRNWFIGIRNPWTLSDNGVWDKTHKIGGKLFKISGIITIFGLLFRDFEIIFILVPILISVVFTMVYSYLEYNKAHRKKRKV